MACDRPIGLLCDTHMIPILLFLSESGPVTKTRVYSAVGRNANMPSKLDALERAGLISIENFGITSMVSLTDIGANVARDLGDIDDLMSTQ
ncbi:hypothetical protein JS82_06055 [Methanomassiliicoccaceae archaeon DOK]|nr:hypothetical protein JS82_06055 [Methanomassiliicoccaceae archaeon DOK]